MPTYAYTCTSCQHGFEVKQSFTDDALTTCPECSGRLRKVFNSVGVVFKGSGFYRNDSRKPEGSGSSTSSDTGSGSSKEGSGASKEGSGSKDAAASTSGGKDSSGSGGAPAKPAAPSTSSSSSTKSATSS